MSFKIIKHPASITFIFLFQLGIPTVGIGCHLPGNYEVKQLKVVRKLTFYGLLVLKIYSLGWYSVETWEFQSAIQPFFQYNSENDI